MAAAKMAKFAVEGLKLKRMAIIHDQMDYGRTGADVIEETLKNYGIKVLARESFRLGDKDFSGQLLKVRESGAEGVFVWGIYGEVARLMKQAKELGIRFVLLASDAQAYPDYIKLAGPEVAEGTYSEVVWVATDPDPAVQAFIRNYKARFGEEPDPGAALAYDTVHVLAKAIERAGGLDRTKIRDALRATAIRGHRVDRVR